MSKSTRHHLTLSPLMHSLVERIREVEQLPDNNEGLNRALYLLLLRGYYGGMAAEHFGVEETEEERALVDEWNALTDPKLDFPDWMAGRIFPAHGGFRGERPKVGDIVRTLVELRQVDDDAVLIVPAGTRGRVEGINRRFLVIATSAGKVAAKVSQVKIVRRTSDEE